MKVLNREDLNRTIVKSNSSTVIIPELELTIPSSRGQLTNIEGLLRDIVGDLSADQPLRRIENEAVYTKVQEIIDKCKDILGDGDEDEDEDEPTKASEADEEEKPVKPMEPFTVTIDDPAGNSFIEFEGSMSDPKWNMRTYKRTFEQNVTLGLVDKDAPHPNEQAVTVNSLDDIAKTGDEEKPLEGNEELFVFPGSCGSCGHPSNTIIKKLTIPYFKVCIHTDFPQSGDLTRLVLQDVLIMSTTCEHCGYRDSEVKSGSAISPLGKKITLKVEDQEDLSRDILKVWHQLLTPKSLTHLYCFRASLVVSRFLRLIWFFSLEP